MNLIFKRTEIIQSVNGPCPEKEKRANQPTNQPTDDRPTDQPTNKTA